MIRNASEAAAETVGKIRGNENVDMIVCVSHSGTSEEERKSEDEILAKAVPEIDLIIIAAVVIVLALFVVLLVLIVRTIRRRRRGYTA